MANWLSMPSPLRLCSSIAWGLLLAACVIADLDASGKACPCVVGYICDSSRNLCVPLGADGAAPDGGEATSGGGGSDTRAGDSSSEASLPCPSPGATLMDDPHNCGRCGHDCLGGVCSAGVCQPEMLYGQLGGGPDSLASDGVNLYWSLPAGPYGVYGGAVDGSRPPRVLVSVPGTNTVAVDSTSLYFTTSGLGLFDYAKDSGGSGLPKQLSPLVPAIGLALDSANVYWTIRDPDGGLFSCAKANGCAGPALIAAMNFATEVAAAGGHVLWTSVGALYDHVNGAVTALVPMGSGVIHVAAGGSMVYWSNAQSPSSNSLWACQLSACNAGQAAAPDAGTITALAADDAGAYYADQAGEVWSYSPSSGPSLLLSGRATVTAIAVDQSAVYWGELPGQIVRLARP